MFPAGFKENRRRRRRRRCPHRCLARTVVQLTGDELSRVTEKGISTMALWVNTVRRELRVTILDCSTPNGASSLRRKWATSKVCSGSSRDPSPSKM